jgi:hypothetical protein
MEGAHAPPSAFALAMFIQRLFIQRKYDKPRYPRSQTSKKHNQHLFLDRSAQTDILSSDCKQHGIGPANL